MANYNDRNKFGGNKMKEMEEERTINKDKNIISLKKKTEIKKEEQKEARETDSIIFKIENGAEKVINRLNYNSMLD